MLYTIILTKNMGVYEASINYLKTDPFLTPLLNMFWYCIV